jgi:hypothetical protein
MRDCRKYREDWIAPSGASSVTPPDCEDCRRFSSEAMALLAALAAAEPRIPEPHEDYWVAFDGRLKAKLVEEISAKAARGLRMKWIAALATAATVVMAITWGSLRLIPPATDPADSTPPDRIEFVDDHIAGLDSDVVAYLGQSELFLRTFAKIESSNLVEIEDARLGASRKLAEIAEQKAAAEDFAPVGIALDEYESVLRDIKNLRSPEEITDIQGRIQRNGLIANFKAYQPRIVLVSQR